MYRVLAVLTVLCASAAAEPAWTVTRSANFELWSDADPHTIHATLAWFEQLRAFSLQNIGVPPASVTIVVFRSAADYNALRPTPDAAAFSASMGSRHYVVMSADLAGTSGIAAHEYAHILMHSTGVELPRWMAEGLAEVYSSLHIGIHSSTVGGDLPGRSATLARQLWMPLPDLLGATDDPHDLSLFYAQSWALTQMLLFSPEYAPRFSALTMALLSGTPSDRALSQIYGKPLADITHDLLAWALPARFPGISLPGLETSPLTTSASTVTSFERRRLMANVLFAAGDRVRAAAFFTELQREAPADPGIPAALGEIALQQSNTAATLRAWKQAIDHGSRDAQLCFRYASLAQEAGYSETEVRPVLERAVALDPTFDDARFTLALIQMNVGEFEHGIAQLRAMRHVAPHRAFAYWCAMANALNELDRRDEAKTAALEADRHASTAAEHARAADLAYVAATDVSVQFERDASGAAHLVTTRVPHGVSDWNPFVEPADQMRRVDGMLINIDCSGSPTRLTVAAAHRRLTLSIPDPRRVQMHNAPAEFVCGPQSAHVIVDYAAQNSVVRAMDFK